MIEQAREILKLDDVKEEDKEGEKELMEKTKELYDTMVKFNKEELCDAIAETLDIEEKKKNSTSVFATIFKYMLSLSLLGAMLNYVLFGPKGFKMPKYQNMQSESSKK